MLSALVFALAAFMALAVDGAARAQPVLNGCIQDTYDAYDGGGSLKTAPPTTWPSSTS